MIRLFRAGRQIVELLGNKISDRAKEIRSDTKEIRSDALRGSRLEVVVVAPWLRFAQILRRQRLQTARTGVSVHLVGNLLQDLVNFQLCFPLFLCCAIVSCHISHIFSFSLSSHWMFTSSSSGSSASFTFERLVATVVPFVRASEFARVSGSLSSCLHFSIEIRKI